MLTILEGFLRLAGIVLVVLVALLNAEDVSATPATYYADGYAGGITASGAQYDPSGYTAAHPDPSMLGEVVDVCTIDDCVSVTITDTCACGIDLSKAAFLELAPLEVGVVDVAIY